MDETALRAAVLRVTKLAYRDRDFDALSPQDQEAILVCLIEYSAGNESLLAERSLYHRREAAKHQLQLEALIKGIGGKSEG
ncbi:hypothetical protein [Actomonas aquatica]|uniref:Uncharacterized protein n=1 Tax=Actomonas aquatica TaxID=2866162 RepID=A0ABZ1CDA2_9BACT|nr:hypothetical protein [Opitutus sp. WL0086]WRQ89386.1 hypothetical protein K1X11_008190 [Opitutus sp. WL0086]